VVNTCALDGCQNHLVEPVAGQSRRYCCAAHRKIARKRRLTPPTAEPHRSVGVALDVTVFTPTHPTPAELVLSGAAPAEPAPVEPGLTPAPRGEHRPAQPDHQAMTDPPTDPIPVLQPGYRNLVPEPRSRWFSRSARPHAVPSSRAHHSVDPAPPPDEPSYRTFVPEPTSRWFRRSARPYAARGVRPSRVRRSVDPPSPVELGWAPPTKTESGTDTRTEKKAISTRRAKKLAKPHPRIQLAWLGQMREALHAALHSLTTNRLRSLLTTIGIIAGVASVIALIALGDGMTKNFNDTFSQFSTQISIKPVTGPVATGKAPQHLTDTDLRALQNTRLAPDVVELSPVVLSQSVTLTYDQQKAGGVLEGIVGNFLALDNRHLAAGRWFTNQEITDGVRQAVIGPLVVDLLFGQGTDPHSVLGQSIRVGHNMFQIQGVLTSDGQADNVVMAPLNAARAYVVGNNVGKLDLIVARSASPATLNAAEGEIYDVIDNLHHVRTQTDRDFTVTDNTSYLNQQQQQIKFMSMFIVAIAAISLFVGGVGVANIMLVSVTERTREIGIRKAIGAPRRAIMRQFLSEAVMVTALGGLVGSVLGIGLCLLGRTLIPKLYPPDPSADTPTPIPILSVHPVLLAFGVSLLIGLIAGGYPAYRASRLRPIEALRFE
jgi:ABC-type antimicrobial peptide transport system permease subunit